MARAPGQEDRTPIDTQIVAGLFEHGLIFMAAITNHGLYLEN